MYDPDTGTVLEMDDLHHPRHYHSVAPLLPSGKVMTAGGASDTGCSLSVQNTIEVFSPPYLFRGARPNIDDADDTASYGAPFRIRSRDAAGIDEVVLMRPMSVTHQTDTEQRRLELTFARSGDILTATAPRDGNAAPAGFYLLFLLKEGVPSEARWVQLRQSRAGRPRKSDLVVTDLRTTGPPTVNDRNSVEVPVQAVVRNQGNAPAGIFKVAAAYTDPATGRSNVVSFTVPGQSSVWYPYTSANLSPGDQVTFNGNLTFNSSLHGVTVVGDDDRGQLLWRRIYAELLPGRRRERR